MLIPPSHPPPLLPAKMDILCLGCPTHSGFSHSAADFWGVTALSMHRKSFSYPWQTWLLHLHTGIPLISKKLLVFLPFPHLHVSADLARCFGKSRDDQKRTQAQEIVRWPLLWPQTLYSDTITLKKRLVTHKVEKSIWHLIILCVSKSYGASRHLKDSWLAQPLP